jgi:hypothetical protein
VTIDPTFSLGNFDVTQITYKHLLLECKRSGNHPICIGPILIHYRKSFSTYLFFTSSLVGLRKELCGIKAFGTDGEKVWLMLLLKCVHQLFICYAKIINEAILR